MMKPQSIQVSSNSAEYTTLRANVANVFDQIAAVKPKLGQILYVPNKTIVNGGTLTGYAFVLKLRDAANVELPGSSEICIGVLRPNSPADRPEWITKFPYQVFFGLEINEQTNDRQKGRIAQAIDLNKHPIEIREDDVLVLEVKSSAVVDWTNGRSFFDLSLGKVNK